jgi:hypothetical protein
LPHKPGLMWTAAALAALRTREGFRLRGGDITRLESLTDGAFALALTYLVIAANEVPHSYQDLIVAFKQAPAFAASFAVMLPFWYSHVTWSRRFGLEDVRSTILTGCFIFVMLIFVLPLKIAFAAGFSYLSGGWLPSLTQIGTLEQLRLLFIAYGLGFTLMEGCLGGLYYHAWRLRQPLALDPLEQVDTQYSLGRTLCGMGIGLLAMLVALLAPPQFAPMSGWSYALLAGINPLLRRRRNRQRQELQAA